MVHKWQVMPPGVTDANAVTTAFFQGRTAMMMLSTGSLSFVRENMKTPYGRRSCRAQLVNAAPIGGASLIIPSGNSPERQAAAWTLINWLVSPEIAGGWSRFTGYFAPRIAAYDLPEMKSYLAEHPNAKVALDQLQYARGWFATYDTVAVRKALEDGVQAVLSGKTTPEDGDGGGAEAGGRADEALRGSDGAEAAAITPIDAPRDGSYCIAMRTVRASVLGRKPPMSSGFEDSPIR